MHLVSAVNVVARQRSVLVCSHKLPQHWAMGMLVNEQQREVILATRPQGPQPSACIVTMSLDQPFDMKSSWTLNQTTLISCITMMPGSESFVVGRIPLPFGSLQWQVVDAMWPFYAA